MKFLSFDKENIKPYYTEFHNKRFVFHVSCFAPLPIENNDLSKLNLIKSETLSKLECFENG